MEFIYPGAGDNLHSETAGREYSGVTFQLAHGIRSVVLAFDNSCRTVRFIHQMRLVPKPGKHTVTVVDEAGNSRSVGFNIAENRL